MYSMLELKSRCLSGMYNVCPMFRTVDKHGEVYEIAGMVAAGNAGSQEQLLTLLIGCECLTKSCVVASNASPCLCWIL
jgi:hypothetical protein